MVLVSVIVFFPEVNLSHINAHYATYDDNPLSMHVKSEAVCRNNKDHICGKYKYN